MREFFLHALSHPAPFWPDPVDRYIAAVDGDEAAYKFRLVHEHPSGWHRIYVYRNADEYHKGRKPLLTWHHE